MGPGIPLGDDSLGVHADGCGALQVPGKTDLSDYSEAQSGICCCRKTLFFTCRRNPLQLGYGFYLAPPASP